MFKATRRGNQYNRCDREGRQARQRAKKKNLRESSNATRERGTSDLGRTRTEGWTDGWRKRLLPLRLKFASDGSKKEEEKAPNGTEDIREGRAGIRQGDHNTIRGQKDKCYPLAVVEECGSSGDKRPFISSCNFVTFACTGKIARPSSHWEGSTVASKSRKRRHKL